MEKCDYVIVSSERLYQTKKPYNKNTFLVTHGVDTAHFRKACDPQTVVPGEMKELSKPVIGFFGLIADWVDLELIRFLAVARPGWNFALIGKITSDVKLFDELPNVHLLGQKSYEALPGYVKAFDVAILQGSRQPPFLKHVWKRRFCVSKQQGTDDENRDTRRKHQRYFKRIRLGALEQGIAVTGDNDGHRVEFGEHPNIRRQAIQRIKNRREPEPKKHQDLQGLYSVSDKYVKSCHDPADALSKHQRHPYIQKDPKYR